LQAVELPANPQTPTALSPQAVVELIADLSREIRIILFATGSANLDEFRMGDRIKKFT
jgi:isopentenyl diphosphate isomerase/L-lactate dehydrogenase-like FMN-dependent dehydrogenase